MEIQPHHVKPEPCYNRPTYRDGKTPKCVKVNLKYFSKTNWFIKNLWIKRFTPVLKSPNTFLSLMYRRWAPMSSWSNSSQSTDKSTSTKCWTSIRVRSFARQFWSSSKRFSTHALPKSSLTTMDSWARVCMFATRPSTSLWKMYAKS